jgi:MFS family permease
VDEVHGMTALLKSENSARRWLAVGAGSLAMASGFGVISTVAPLMQPLENEFGWLRADMSGAYTLASLGAAMGGLFWGAMADRFDTRWIAVCGALVLGSGLILLSRQSGLPAVQITYLVMGAAGFACLYTPVITAVGAWFNEGRGLAIGVVTAGGALGQGVMPVTLQHLLDAVGWRTACVVIGLAYLVGLAPVMLLLSKPEVRGTALKAGQGRSWNLSPHVSVALLALAAVLCCTCMAVPLVHLLPYLIGAGQSPTSAATVVLAIMLTGTVAFGALADRVGGLASYALAAAIQSATVYMLVGAESVVSLYIIALVFGFGFSGVMTCLIVCVREAVPARSYGFATAVVGMAAWFGMGTGGYLGGYCFDATKAYEASFAGAAAAGTVNLALLLGLWVLVARAGSPHASSRPSALPGPT